MNNLKAVYIDNEHSRFWLGQMAWAKKILSAPDAIFLNGKSSHACANEVLEEAELELLSDYAIQVMK